VNVLLVSLIEEIKTCKGNVVPPWVEYAGLVVLIVMMLFVLKFIPALNVFDEKNGKDPLKNVRVPDAKEAVELYSVPSVSASASLDE